MFKHLRPAIVMIVLMTALCGLAYPFAITGIAGLAFPDQAGGSLVRDKAGRVVGSMLIAQAFTRPEYLHPRPSAAGMGYDASSSSGSNLGPLDPKLSDRVKGDVKVLAKDAGSGPIPADAVTASGSGLDPDISPQNARMQAARVAAARGAPTGEVLALIDRSTKGRALGVFGQPRVNVLAVNRALDTQFPAGPPKT